MRYQSKPVVKEAFQLHTHYLNWPEWAVEALSENAIVTHNMGKFRDNSKSFAEIKTLEGVMRAEVGDFIIQGLNGELYPCKPDIFEKSYEPVTQPQGGK